MNYTITTLGCKVNQYETQAMETLLQAHGHRPVDNGTADIIIVNTCAVTAESGRKSRQAVRHLQHQNPDALVAVCGCFSQISPEEIKELGADIIYGSGDRKQFVEDIERVMQERERILNIDDPFRRMVFETLPAGAVSGRTRAMLKIQDGCVNFCTYCVIPYARGRVRSLPVSEAAAMAAELEAQGFRELVVTGIEIASYGKDLQDGTGLADVIVAIAEAAPKLRLRLGSIEPTVVTEDFCRRLAATGSVCPHFHLSLQSGCDSTLQRMNRKYNTAEFYAVVERLRKWFPHCALTADLIVGFPGETEEDHAAAMEFIQKCGFSSMHIFPYSQRPGTKAAVMPGQLTRAEKAARAKQAQQIAAAMQTAYLNSCIGQVIPVLFETEEDGVSRGHADNYCEVCLRQTGLHGLVKNVEIIGVEAQMLVAKLIDG